MAENKLNLGYPDCFDLWWDVIDNAEAAGVVVTWSAGNEGTSGLRSPADRATTFYNCFSVGSTTTYPPFEIAASSSRGPAGPTCGPSENLTKPEIAARAHIGSMEEYERLYRLSLDDPETFWAKEAENISWFHPWRQVFDSDYDNVDFAWFLGGRLNACYNCVDRHLEERGDQDAIIWAKDEPGEYQHISYRQLKHEVSRVANVLKKHGVEAVLLYFELFAEREDHAANFLEAFGETELMPSEPVTVILSEKGWVRSAKGHDIDPEALNFKAGDEYRHSARGRSNQQAVFLDSTGRAYALPSHSLPSARGQGEPLSSRFKPPDGAAFCGAMIGDGEQKYLLASDAGYGFIAKLGDLVSRNKAGKATLSVPKGCGVMPPVAVRSLEEDWIVAATTEGYMLVIPLADLPQMARGKGNRIINVPSAKLKAREEYVAAMDLIQDGEKLTVYAGKKHKTMKADEVDEHAGERGRRGRKLPRGYQKVDRVEVQIKG